MLKGELFVKATVPLNVGLPLSVPLREAPLMVGEVSVLLVRVSVLSCATRVPVVGSVTLVPPVVVRVRALAPEGERRGPHHRPGWQPDPGGGLQHLGGQR